MPISYIIRRPKEVALKQPGVRRALGRYTNIVMDRLPAKFMISKKVPVKFSSVDDLWKVHANAMKKYRALEKDIDAGKKDLDKIAKPKQSLLDLKIALADKIMSSCHFCVRRCGVDRLKGQKGFCKAGTDWRIYGAHPHYGEEAELVPSGTIFQAACTIRCVYCQNAPESINPELGTSWTIEQVADWIETIRKAGAYNINWVGGDPTPWTWQILRAMRLCNVNVPQIWNSNSYYSPETADLLDGVIDLYLLDIRYLSENCAVQLSQAPGYPEVAAANSLRATKAGELLIRLLILPGHLECDAKPIVKWIRDYLGPDARLNLLTQYYPTYKASKFPEIDRPLKIEEWEEVVNYAKEIGLKNLVRD